jgi:ferredoxin
MELPLNCTLYWFSGTGNSRALAISLEKALANTNLTWMGDVRKGETCPTDCVGFVFPVYCFGIPNIVRRALQDVSIARDAYVFSVATMGSVPGACHSQVRALLHEKGNTLAAGWSIRMPGNFTPLREPPDAEGQQKLFAAAEKKINEIAGIVAARAKGPLEDSRLPVNWIAGGVSRIAASHLPGQDKKFHLPEACSTCGTCVRVCPVGNIVFEDDGLHWLGKCEQCFACLQWCPVEAIQWGGHTQNRKRYHHPAFKAADFFLRHDEGTAADGGDDEDGRA